MGAAVRWQFCLYAAALSIGSPSIAAPADQPELEQERGAAPLIVITGSRIPRSDLTAVSPVTMVNGDEFKLQGALTFTVSESDLVRVFQTVHLVDVEAFAIQLKLVEDPHGLAAVAGIADSSCKFA